MIPLNFHHYFNILKHTDTYNKEKYDAKGKENEGVCMRGMIRKKKKKKKVRERVKDFRHEIAC